MNNLIIDCSAGMGVYLVSKNEIYSKVDCNIKKHTDELLNVVDELLKDANISIKDIDNICVCVGPGSFTGIRVAISIAKGLAIGAGAKVFVASNFDTLMSVNDGDCIYILEGFSKFLYVRKCVKGSVLEDCVSLDDLINDIKNNNYKVYVQNEKVQKLLNNYEIYSIIAQNNIILCFNDKIDKNKSIELNQISPVYLRASQAEMERNSKLSGAK